MKKQKWVVMAKKADFERIGRTFGIDQVTARLIRNRDIESDEQIAAYLDDSPLRLHDPNGLKDAGRAAVLLSEKIKKGKKIRVIGDYDIDGVNAAYILIMGFKRCGCLADYAIPHRIRDGYGLNRDLIDRALEDGVDTVVTCDNGISAYDEIKYAKQKGLAVIVTDHHDVPFEYEADGGVEKKRYRIPPADAVVNPKQADCAYPYKGLCGAAVAWKLVQVLYGRMGIPAEESYDMLAHVAFATVGDVMDLTGENRLIVKLGLKAIHKTDNPGLLALIQKNNLEKEQVKAWHFGFVLGPCINASGRLDTAKRSLQLLLASSVNEAAALAGELVEMNSRRKEMTERGLEAAERKIAECGIAGDAVMVVYLPDCHESIAGIIAGRIRERYHKPVFVLTDAEDGVKGSGRSIEGYSMYDEMCRCRELFTRFGGHPMAAGLSMEAGMAERFRARINALAQLSEEDFVEKVRIDVPMPLYYPTPSLVREFELLEPFGKGNGKPLFAVKNVQLLRGRIVGKNRNVLKLWLSDGRGGSVPGVYFGDVEAFLDFLRERYSPLEAQRLLAGGGTQIMLSVTYELSLNTWQGNEQLEIVIRDYC